MRRSRRKRNNKAKKVFINTILIGSILVIITCIITEKLGENHSKGNNYLAEKLSQEGKSDNQVIEEITEYPKEKIDNIFNGYEVCAKLEIPKISLKTNVLREYSKKALSICVTRFWGVKPNTLGNFCIAGHNTKSKNMFYNLKNLKIGDTIFLTDHEVGKVEYEVFKIYKVSPNNTDCLDPLTKYEREITLITCTNDAQKRLIIKAREV